MGDGTVEIHLTLSIEDDSLAGLARSDRGTRRFDGRLGLLAAIDALTMETSNAEERPTAGIDG